MEPRPAVRPRRPGCCGCGRNIRYAYPYKIRTVYAYRILQQTVRVDYEARAHSQRTGWLTSRTAPPSSWRASLFLRPAGGKKKPASEVGVTSSAMGVQVRLLTHWLCVTLHCAGHFYK